MALQQIKQIFPKLKDLNKILKNSSGIAKIVKRMQSMRSKDYDIAFKIGKTRAYLHCKKKNSSFLVVSAHEV